MMINLSGRFGIEENMQRCLDHLTNHNRRTNRSTRSNGFVSNRVVSLHERSANVAAEIIRNRTGCDVLVVTSHENDYRTKAASDKDLILFVWSATKHSVYRAFDTVREKLCYVQGSGAASIVRSLEQHVQRAAIQPN